MTEYVRGGNLANPWHTNDQPMWSPLEISCILYQCLHALAHLHAKPNTIHRNIKPENILVGHRYPSPHVKIGDFGFTKEGSMLGGKGGSWMYTAPEVLSGMSTSQQSSLYRHSNSDRKTDLGGRSTLSSPVIARYRIPNPKNAC